ncbi:carbohydrate-binding domain-containing protein [Globicatella sanguinis]
MKKQHLLLLSSILVLSACGAANAQESNQESKIELTTTSETPVSETAGASHEEQTDTTTTNSEAASTQTETTSNEATAETTESSELFSERDLNPSYDATTAKITLNENEATVEGTGVTFDNQVITISDEGVYEISGNSDGVQIVVAADDTAKVQLVFNGVTMTNEESPILVESADKVFLTLASNSQNSLTDGTTRQDESIDGVIFSRSDLTINGDGALTINGQFNNGIESKDDLKIIQAKITITAVNNALKANDVINIEGATLDLTAGKAGIHAKNDDDPTLGNVYLNPTSLTINATEDGVDAFNELVIAGGNINITNSTEGLEAKTIHLQEGVVNIVSTDDGINASDGSGSETMEGFGGPGGGDMQANEELAIVIEGGILTVNAEGDGLDSNGSITINGGEVYVEGSQMGGNDALDANGQAIINAGTVIAIGTADMAQGLTAGADQASISVNVSGQIGSLVEIADENGNVLASYTANKPFQNVVASVAGMNEGQTYQVLVDGDATTVEATSVASQNQMGPGGQPMMPPTGGFEENGEGPGGPNQNGQPMTPPNGQEQNGSVDATSGASQS